MANRAEAIRLLGLLEADLNAHEQQEGEPVEMRNTRGGWEDVIDRVREIKEVLS